MTEQLQSAAGNNGTYVSNTDEFYIRRVNWLVTAGRPDLIDEIAEDCETRRSSSPKPVETGTRLAVASLRRSARPTYRHEFER